MRRLFEKLYRLFHRKTDWHDPRVCIPSDGEEWITISHLEEHHLTDRSAVSQESQSS